jgi:hypothetical protein
MSVLTLGIAMNIYLTTIRKIPQGESHQQISLRNYYGTSVANKKQRKFARKIFSVRRILQALHFNNNRRKVTI